MKRFACWLLVILVLSPANLVFGQVANDLEAGRQALQQGDLETAQRLLESAAQNLPESVEAQLSLADCYLKLGLLDQAVRQYRAVLKLSPEHAQANAVVNALTDRSLGFQQQISAARTMIEIGAYAEAISLLGKTIQQPWEPQQRDAAILLKLEAQLWLGKRADIIPQALQLIQRNEDPAVTGPVRIILALAQLQAAENNLDSLKQAATLVQQAGGVDEPWATRAKLVTTFLALQQTDMPADASKDLAEPFSHIPASGFRNWAELHAARQLLHAAQRLVGQNAERRALELVWPMVSVQPLPDHAQVLQPIEINAGWLTVQPKKSDIDQRLQNVLVAAAHEELKRRGPQASLLGVWLAAELNRQRGDETTRAERLVKLAEHLPALSHPSPNRNKGQALTMADRIQLRILRNAAGLASKESVKQQLVQLLLGQLTRYEQSGDLAAGLAQFVVLTNGADAADVDAITVELVEPLGRLAPGPAHHNWMLSLAAYFQKIGQAEFNKTAATLQPAGNEKLNANDAIALIILRQVYQQYFTFEAAAPAAHAIADRYANAGHWPAADAALEMFYADTLDAAAKWAKIQLAIRRVVEAENQALAVNRELGDSLSESLRQAIDEISAMVQSDAGPDVGQRAKSTLQPLIDRYVGLSRIDLAAALLGQLENGEGANPLADWVLWMRINLAEVQANRELAVAIKQLAHDETLKLNGHHQTELQLINQLLSEYAESVYRGSVVDRLLTIARGYQQHRSFAVATSILADFHQANPNLTRGPQVEFEIVKFALNRAQLAFSERPASDSPPAALSAEYLEAIKLLGEFLQSHPTGDFSTAAETELFQVITVYGEAGGWAAAREAVDQFSRAIPDFRSPLHLKLLRAATYLGELDRQYAISLLRPLAAPSSQPATGIENVGALASNVYSLDRFIRADEETGDADPSSRDSSTESETSKLADHLNLEAGAGTSAIVDPPASGGLLNLSASSRPAQPSETALAMIRQSQQRQYNQIAMMEDVRGRREFAQQQDQKIEMQQGQDAISLPSGNVLSEAEMKRQDEAAARAYEILIDVMQQAKPEDEHFKEQARMRIMWLFGFFEGQLRADQAIVWIDRYLQDQPHDPAKVALAYQAINDQLTWAAQRQPGDRINLAWLETRHRLFETARQAIQLFIIDFADEQQWVNRAQLLIAESYDRESTMTMPVSSVRAGGLLVRSADALITLLQTVPDHPECNGFAQRLWNIADRLRGLGQSDGAIYVLSQIPIRFPTHDLSRQAVLRIAELHAAGLAQPLKAVETYQEFLSLNGDNEQVRSQIFGIAQQLGSQQRYLESLHVYGVFVDSFPTDPRAPQALQAMARTHQTNEAWDDALTIYRRILKEYESSEIVPQVKLAVADCEINLSHWRDARKLYEDYLQQYPDDPQTSLAQSRIELLKKLDRYEALLADVAVQRHKDDAQYEIGRIVLSQLQNPVKAIREFRKVVETFPESDVADDAQLEIGKALLSLQRLDSARTELLKVPPQFPTSPLADDALYLVAQSYEQQAARIASVTLQRARAEAVYAQQRGAYQEFNESVEKELQRQAQKRIQLKREGKSRELALDEAAQSFRLNSLALSGLSSTARRAEQLAETESALQVANRRDQINEANREAVKLYMRAATEYPLGDKTDESLLRIAQIFETQLKDRPAAMETYQKIVKLFPGTPVAEDAAWNVARFYESEGQFELAATALRDFIRNYPASGRIADAQFSLAEVLEELGQWVDAMDEYETFRQKFSEHPKAVVAQEQINWIRTYRK